MIEKNEVHDILKQIVTEGTIKSTSKGFNFRCPICGDSQKSKSKKRGWVLFDNSKVTYVCHNGGCTDPISFKRLIKEKYPQYYDQYFKIDLKNVNFKKDKNYEYDVKIIKSDEVTDISNKISEYSFHIFAEVDGIIKKQLQEIAKDVIRERKIPSYYYKDFLVCYEGDFKDRLIIPFYDNQDRMYAFQARSLCNQDPKYLTYCEDNIKIYNYYNVDPNEYVYIFEGCIDSFFVNNSIATSGLLGTENSELYELIKEKFPKRIWVFDNFYQDEAGLKKIEQFAEAGERVFLWPKVLRRYKDINEMIMKADVSKKTLTNYIFMNSGKGLTATLQIKLLKNKLLEEY